MKNNIWPNRSSLAKLRRNLTRISYIMFGFTPSHVDSLHINALLASEYKAGWISVSDITPSFWDESAVHWSRIIFTAFSGSSGRFWKARTNTSSMKVARNIFKSDLLWSTQEVSSCNSGIADPPVTSLNSSFSWHCMNTSKSLDAATTSFRKEHQQLQWF